MEMIGAQAAGLLEALHEPAMLLDPDGTIVRDNRALKRLLGTEVARCSLFELAEDDPAKLERYLGRCLGTGEALLGSMQLRVEDRALKIQCKGSAVRFDDQKLVLLRLSETGVPRFTALSETLVELRKELKKRRLSEAMLNESIREREVLLLELEHRVKNNLQVLSGLLSGAERDASSPEVKAALRDAALRFSAVKTVHQLLYRSEDPGTVGSQPLIKGLIETATSQTKELATVEIIVEPLALPVEAAVPFSLILTELLNNAVKYGRPTAGAQKLCVEFTRSGDEVRLVVQDNGLGFEPPETLRRASGIGLVRGLVRQLGGSFAVERLGGSRCVAIFPSQRVS